MTAPDPSLAAQWAQLAADMAAPDASDKYLPPAQVPVVRAYRALTYALLATYSLSAPSTAVPEKRADTP